VTENSSRPLLHAALPLLGSLLLTGGIVYLSCRPPLRPTLTWPGVLALALLDVLIAGAVHVLAVLIICNAFRQQIELPIRSLICSTWMSAAWLPLLALLIREHSVWMASVPPLMMASAVLFLRRWRNSSEDDQPSTSRDEAAASSLFSIQKSPSILHSVLPAALTSIALQAGVGALLFGHSIAAGSLFAICAIFPIWSSPTKVPSDTVNRKVLSSIRSLVADSAVVILLTAIALIPFLQHGTLAASLAAFLQITRSQASNLVSQKHADIKTPDSSYSGVLLILPPKPRQKIVPPAPVSHMQMSSLRARPVIIPFDGAYWYFKRPDRRPKADARTVRGDPTKVNVRSIDFKPLSMEAHQYLGTAIRMDCCSAIRIAIRNADDRPGAISIEVLLNYTASKESSPQSLGTLVLASSEDRRISLSRPPVDEVLSFPFPLRAHGRQFDEITVAVKPAQERARAGAHIAIQHFELVP
jgi:hypothetical protein